MAVFTAPARIGQRIEGIDTLRGACVVLMVLFHFSYDLHYFCAFPRWVVFNPAMTVIQGMAFWGFMLLAGISSRLSRSNLKRGALVLCCSAVVSVVTYLWGDLVRFGILQFLGCAMLIYGLTHKFWENLPKRAAPAVYLALFAVSRVMFPRVMDVPYLYPLGIITPEFRSADYYPLFPWLFLFLFGSWLGGFVKRDELPPQLLRLKQRQLAFLGRHSLAVYFIHQPVLIGVSAVLALLTGHSLPL